MDLKLLEEQFGEPYTLTGKVIKGHQIGRTIGFPTANIDYGNKPLPENGVYSTNIVIDGISYLSMTNIGYNPTLQGLDHKSLEVNIFNFDQDIYNKEVTLQFNCFIRPEKKFASGEELIQQLKNDQKKIIQLSSK